MQQRGHGSAGAHPQVQEPPDSLYQHVGYGGVPGHSPMHGHQYPSSSPISQGASQSCPSSWRHSRLHLCSNKCKRASPLSSLYLIPCALHSPVGSGMSQSIMYVTRLLLQPGILASRDWPLA